MSEPNRRPPHATPKAQIRTLARHLAAMLDLAEGELVSLYGCINSDEEREMYYRKERRWMAAERYLEVIGNPHLRRSKR